MKKNQWFNYIYWSIGGLVIGSIILVLAFFNAHKSVGDSLAISSAILLGISLLTLLFKFGLIEKTVIKYRNSKFNVTSKNEQDKKLDLDAYHQILKKRKWWPILGNVIFYSILFIIAFFV